MITTTHVTLNGLLGRLAGSDRSGRLARVARMLAPDRDGRVALLLGGLAPDVGLAVLAAGATAWFPLAEGWSLERTFAHVWRDLFFDDPAWVAVHNLLHAPLVLGALVAVGATAARRGGMRWGRLLAVFAIGCLLHTALDIPTHVEDGPLLLFPFEWSTRFHSPVSYYDPGHYGWLVGPIDVAITVVGGGWLLATWWRARRASAAPEPGGG